MLPAVTLFGQLCNLFAALSFPSFFPTPTHTHTQGPAKGPAKVASAGPQLVAGQFTIEPSEGTVQPGGKVEVAVVFKAEGARVYRCGVRLVFGSCASKRCFGGLGWDHKEAWHLNRFSQFLLHLSRQDTHTHARAHTHTHTHTSPRPRSEVLGIDVSERNFDDAPNGITYEVGGESCIPGIDTSNLESIFEEHNIAGSLDPSGAVPCQLGLRERAFNFGAVIADLTSAPPPAAGACQRLPLLACLSKQDVFGVG